MNGKQFMNAMGYIDDKYILKYAEVKPVTTKIKIFQKLLAVSAAVCMTIAIVFTVNTLINKSPNVSTEPPYQIIFSDMQYVLFNNYRYEIITGEYNFSKHHLPKEIGKVKGKLIGQGYVESTGQTVKVYTYPQYTGNSILIIELNGEYYYIAFWGLSNNNQVLTMPELFELYGVEKATEIQYNDKQFIGNNMTTLIKELEQSTIFSEEIPDIEDMQCIEILITGINMDPLSLYYYPSIRYLSYGNFLYKVTSTATSLLR